MKRSSLGLLGISVLALAGCPVTADDLCAKGACEPSVDATSPPPGDAGTDGIAVAPRDPCIDKPTATECVTNESALFVSKSADPNGADGTIAHPYPSIATALSKVTNARKRVYVCEGTYEEQVTLETVPSTLIGGLACDFRTPASKPKIAPKSGIALGIAAVGGVSVIDIAIEAASDANVPGSSAVGVFITGSTDVLLRGVSITTGAGQPGTAGTDAMPTANHPNVQAPVGVTGGSGGQAGVANTCTACTDGTSSKAGNGGGVSPASFPTSGDATPKVPGQVANGGSSGPTCGVGQPGAHGEPGAKAGGGTVPGKLAAKSWTDRTTTAVAGNSGGPGQGGGGGGTLMSGGGGGSGACGGCGGAGGGPGTDGGSSIGILIHQSTKVVVEKSDVATGPGGKGGKGGAGQKGQEAPADGALGGGGGACKGGAGGHGAGGGGGGGGVGGYSAAIAYVGAAPETPQSVLTPGTAGDPGEGGAGGDPGGLGGKKGENGSPGAASKAEGVLKLE